MANEHESTPGGLTRRQFLGAGSCAALGTTGLMSTLLNMQMVNKAISAAAPGAMNPDANDDYKALVCVFLAGGNDSFNMLIPADPAAYAQYRVARGNMALTIGGPGGALPITPLNTPGRAFALHPSLPNTRELFNAGRAAFVAGVGTLIQPTTVAQYKQGAVRLPRALFSHSDQIMQWQTALPHSASGTGWTGRMADLLNTQFGDGRIGINISLNGNNIQQTGQHTTPYTINPNGSVAMLAHGAGSGRGPVRYEQFTSLLDVRYQNYFEQAYMSEYRASLERSRAFAAAFDSAAVGTPFGTGALATDLKTVARTIAARRALGMRRQTFFVLFGGWDHHQELLNTHAGMLRAFDTALKQFWDALGELGVQNNVVLFTSSDFGRTLCSNGRGTDHAWSGNQLVLGGPVAGARVYGEYPDDLSLGGKWDVGLNGRLLPAVSIDQYFAELALWYGCAPSELSVILPNLPNFYQIGGAARPLGFLA
jgi:uncharacterized protein (DUF1501 family)